MERGQIMERGRLARKDKCGQDARAPSVDQVKWPTRRPRISNRAFPHGVVLPRKRPSGTKTPEKILQLDNGNQNIPKIAGKGLSEDAR
jgi:hypothetical protein